MGDKRRSRHSANICMFLGSDRLKRADLSVPAKFHELVARSDQVIERSSARSRTASLGPSSLNQVEGLPEAAFDGFERVCKDMKLVDHRKQRRIAQSGIQAP